MKRLNAMAETFYPITFRGMEGLFTDMRIDKDTIPNDWCLYEVRESDDGQEPSEISEWILVNFYGSILTQKPITAWDDSYNGKHGLYLKFSDEPEWYEDDDGVTDSKYNHYGEENEPHFCPLESEWCVDYDKPLTIKQYLSSKQRSKTA